MFKDKFLNLDLYMVAHMQQLQIQQELQQLIEQYLIYTLLLNSRISLSI